MIRVEFNQQNFKVWSRAVNTLLKFGNEVTIDIEDGEMTLSTTSDCSSSFVIFTFKKPFFELYQVGDYLCVKLLTKPLANILKLNNDIKKCILNIQNDRLTLEIECVHKVVKVHSFYYEETSLRKAIYSINNENTWSIHPKALMDILLFFSASDEISIVASTDKFEITNSKAINEKRDLNTMVSIELLHFTRYCIKRESILSLDIKEVKKILIFGESFDSNIEANYNSLPGLPFVFLYRPTDYCKAEFVLATFADGTEARELKPSHTLSNSRMNEDFGRKIIESGTKSKHRLTRDNSGSYGQECLGSGINQNHTVPQYKSNSQLNLQLQSSPIQTSIWDEKGDTYNLSQSNSSETLNYTPNYSGKSLFENLKTAMKMKTQDDGCSNDEQVQATQNSKKQKTFL